MLLGSHLRLSGGDDDVYAQRDQGDCGQKCEVGVGGDASVLDVFRYKGARDRVREVAGGDRVREGDEVRASGASKIVLGDHMDPGLFTIELCPSVLGLEIYDPALNPRDLGEEGVLFGKDVGGESMGERGVWVRAEGVCQVGSDILFMCGEQLQRLTSNEFVTNSLRDDSDATCMDGGWGGGHGSGGDGREVAYKPVVIPATWHRVRAAEEERMAFVYEMRLPYAV